MTKPGLPSPILATLAVATLLTVALLSSSNTSAQGQTLTSLEQDVFNLVNQQRAANNLPPLSLDMRLVQSSRAHSQAMINSHEFAHQVTGELPMCASGANNDRYDAVGYVWNRCGENIAAGYATAQTVMDGWMNSPGHRANILSPDYCEFGVGYARDDSDPLRYVHYWTQDFGRSTSTSAPCPSTSNPPPAPTATRTPTPRSSPTPQPTATRTTAPAQEGVTSGVFRPSNGAVYLRNSNTTGTADLAFTYGVAGDRPVAGDWNGDRVDSVGIYRNGAFYLRNSNTLGPADLVIPYGMAGDIPVVGDWDGNGTDTIGIFRGGVFFLRNSNTPGPADMVFAFGTAGDTPITGDWNGTGSTKVGVYRSPSVFFLRNSLTTGPADAAFLYGQAGDLPVTGDWDNNGTATVGVYRNGAFYLRNSNTTGLPDRSFSLGVSGDLPLAGNWDRLP